MRAKPWGSTIKKKIISAPNTINSRLDATEVGNERACANTFKKTGSKTIKAAPKKEPSMEPKPPIITMNKIRKD